MIRERIREKAKGKEHREEKKRRKTQEIKSIDKRDSFVFPSRFLEQSKRILL